LELLRAFSFSRSSNPSYSHDFIIRSTMYIVNRLLAGEQKCIFSVSKVVFQAKKALKSFAVGDPHQTSLGALPQTL